MINDNGNVTAFMNSLSLGLGVDQVDLEVFREWELTRTNVQLSTGVRYLRLKRNGSFEFNLTDSTGDTTDLEVSAASYLEGFGPTFSIETSRIVHDCWRPFVNFRFTVMPGDSYVDVNFDLTQQTGGGLLTNQVNAAIGSGQEHLLLAAQFELQFGAEWNREFRFGDVFLRAAMDLQYWVTELGGINSTGLIGDSGTGGLSLVGGLFSVGLRR
jgi:hypothetical protein